MDCKLVCECSDSVIELLGRRTNLAQAGLLEMIFRKKKPQAEVYTLDFKNMTTDICDATVNLIDRCHTSGKSVDWYFRLLESAIFFMLDDAAIIDVVDQVMDHNDFDISVVVRLANVYGIPEKSFNSFLAFYICRVPDLTQIPDFRPEMWYQKMS